MKKFLTIVILMSLAFQVKSQDSTTTRLEPWMLKMYFFPLSVNLEGRISNTLSVDFGTGVDAG